MENKKTFTCLGTDCTIKDDCARLTETKTSLTKDFKQSKDMSCFNFKQKMHQISLEVEPELFDEIRKIAFFSGMTVPELIESSICKEILAIKLTRKKKQELWKTQKP